MQKISTFLDDYNKSVRKWPNSTHERRKRIYITSHYEIEIDVKTIIIGQVLFKLNLLCKVVRIFFIKITSMSNYYLFYIKVAFSK